MSNRAACGLFRPKRRRWAGPHRRQRRDEACRRRRPKKQESGADHNQRLTGRRLKQQRRERLSHDERARCAQQDSVSSCAKPEMAHCASSTSPMTGLNACSRGLLQCRAPRNQRPCVQRALRLPSYPTSRPRNPTDPHLTIRGAFNTIAGEQRLRFAKPEYPRGDHSSLHPRKPDD